MVEKVWEGKKVRILSLEELERNHYKDKFGKFWKGKNKPKFVSGKTWEMTKAMQKYCGKICEVTEVREDFFKIKEDEAGYGWSFWMVKEPISIQDVLNSD